MSSSFLIGDSDLALISFLEKEKLLPILGNLQTASSSHCCCEDEEGAEDDDAVSESEFSVPAADIGERVGDPPPPRADNCLLLPDAAVVVGLLGESGGVLPGATLLDDKDFTNLDFSFKDSFFLRFVEGMPPLLPSSEIVGEMGRIVLLEEFLISAAAPGRGIEDGTEEES